ncbi:MAG: dihydrodipicolinate synthase family protein [Dehalococcoidia bacterium]
MTQTLESRTGRPKTRRAQGMLGAVDIPWTADYALDEDSFRRLLRRLLTVGADQLYIMGTAGEGYAMTDGRFRDVVDVFVEEMTDPAVLPQVGVISLSTEEVIGRIGYAHDRGVRSFQISLPAWGAVTDPEMMTFFKTVCGEYPDSEFLHYNLARAKRILDGDDYRMILDEVPNLVAAKQNTSDMSLIRSWMQKAPEMQHFMLQAAYGYASQFGECSLLCSMHGVYPELTREYFATGASGDIARALKIAEEFNRHRDGIFGHVDRVMIDGAYDKLLVWLVDQSFPRRLLPPYEGFTDDEARVSLEYYQRQANTAP